MDRALAERRLFGGHFFDTSIVRRNILYLTGIVCGSEFAIKHAASEGRNLAQWGHRFHPVEMIYDDTFTAEVSRLLIEIAATLRILDDIAGSHVVAINFPVGNLLGPTGGTPMRLRDCCNKIIHARQLSFELGGGIMTYVDKNGEEVGECISYALPTILEMRGEQSGVELIAELDFMAFIKAATMVTYRYDDAIDELYEEPDAERDTTRSIKC